MLSKKIGIDLGSSTVQIYVKGEGVVVDEPALMAVNQETIHQLIGKVQGRLRLFKPEIMICVGSAVTASERRAVTEAAISAGARQVWLVDRPLAAAIGAGLVINQKRAVAVCDIGDDTTEIAVIAQSGMVVTRSIHVGGKDFGADEVARSSHEPLDLIVAAIRGVLDETPPRLAADIAERGIVLTGSGAQLRGLERYLAAKTGLPCVLAEDARTSAVRGTGLALENFDVLKRNQAYLR